MTLYNGDPIDPNEGKRMNYEELYGNPVGYKYVRVEDELRDCKGVTA